MQHPCLRREPPDRELEDVGFDLRHVLHLAEGLIKLKVAYAIPELKSQLVVGAGRHNRVLRRVGTAPDLFHDVFSELGLQELKDSQSSDQVETVTILEVLLQQEVLHLVFGVDSPHELLRHSDDVFAKVLAPDLQLIELEGEVCQVFDQKTRTFDHVQVHDKDILLRHYLDLQKNGVDESPCVSKLHLLGELAD